MKLILTSNGLSTPALQAEFRRLVGGDTSQKACWYIPTAPLRDGWSLKQTRAQMAGIQQAFGFRRMEWVDPEYVMGDALRSAVTAISPDVIWAEMGNTYNLCYHLHKSGGDKLITELVGAGAVYVGSSAGSIMAGRMCQMAFWKVRPRTRNASHLPRSANAPSDALLLMHKGLGRPKLRGHRQRRLDGPGGRGGP